MKSTTMFYQALISLILLTGCGGSTSTNREKKEIETVVSESPKAKLSIFNDINKTRQALSENGIGNLGEWKSDQMGGYFSITDYFQFGKGMPQNNLAYYLESEDETYIQTAKLVLNINNKSEEKQAIVKFKDLITLTFNSLSLEIPKELNDAIDKRIDFEISNDNFSTSLKIDKGKIDTWSLAIDTK